MSTTRDPGPVTTVENVEYRIMRRLEGVHDGEWHSWEYLSPKASRATADRRLVVYQAGRGEYRLEARTVVTMSDEWAEVTE